MVLSCAAAFGATYVVVERVHHGVRNGSAGGTTNVRNLKSKHWTRWLAVENRCVVPFNSFSEFNKAEGGDIWFALDESRPLACFAGIWTNWISVRKVREGETTNDLYAFLTRPG